MALILNIETSTTNCSVALCNNGSIVTSLSENNGYSHSENLAHFTSELFNSTNYSIDNIEAVAVSSGPGSYTGLRIGAAFAKGLCASLNKPLIAINTLALMCQAQEVIDSAQSTDLLCPVFDARRDEVYYAILDLNGNYLVQPKAFVLKNKDLIEEDRNLIVFGNGQEKVKQHYSNPNYQYLENILPDAKHMASLSNQALLLDKFTSLHHYGFFLWNCF
jgi:tRNA threonylcarbamoyladenosine biosynthesis protein TsaB